MSELLVRPSYILTENEILTVDKLNLMSTPVVELAIQDPVNDQNFWRNGNFYSSYWEQPAGKVCPAGVPTSNANYWICFPATVGSYSGLTAPFVQPDKDQVPTALSSSFVQPAVNANVTVNVATTAWMLPTQTPPQKIHIAGGGDYSVVSVTDSTHAVVKNLGTGSPAAPAATVPTAGVVSVISSVSITVGATAWMSPTQAIYIEGGGDYTVLSVTDSTHAVVTNLGHTGNAAPGATVQSGGSASPSAAAVTSLRSTLVPDTKSLFSSQLKGAASVGIVEYGQQINADLSATLRRLCTFSGYLYNFTGLTLSPKLNIYTCNAFNNFSAVSLQATVDLQTCANSLWTYCTATVDLAPLANVANGLFITILLPTGTLASTSNSVHFSRLKFQLGELATEFTDDVGLFITTPSIDSTMLQDGCIARPSLFQPNVIPAGAYMAKSIKNGDIDDGAIDGRTIAAGAVASNLGYTPINKAGDTAIGPGSLVFTNNDVVGAGSYTGSAARFECSASNASNDGYMPTISFYRPGVTGRAVGLDINAKFKTVDSAGTVGFLLDTVTKVATADIQDAAITYAKLAQDVLNRLMPIGTVVPFAGVGPQAGWLICDGSAVSRTTYAALFAQLGTYWGVGDNVSTFNIPNLVNKTLIGFGTGTFWAFGTSDIGEFNHTLTTAELPSHTHSITDQQHAHSINAHHHSYVNPIGTSVGVAPGGQSITQSSGTTNTSDTASVMNNSFSNINTTNAAGSGATHNNMQPSASLYYLIKAL